MKKSRVILLAVIPVLFILLYCGSAETDKNPPYYDKVLELMLRTREDVFPEMGLDDNDVVFRDNGACELLEEINYLGLDLQPILLFDPLSDKLCGVAYRQIFFQTSKTEIEETNDLIQQLFCIYGEPNSYEDIETKNLKRLGQIDLRKLGSEKKDVSMADYWLLEDNMLLKVSIKMNRESGTISVMMHYIHNTLELS